MALPGSRRLSSSCTCSSSCCSSRAWKLSLFAESSFQTTARSWTRFDPQRCAASTLCVKATSVIDYRHPCSTSVLNPSLAAPGSPPTSSPALDSHASRATRCGYHHLRGRAHGPSLRVPSHADAGVPRHRKRICIGRSELGRNLADARAPRGASSQLCNTLGSAPWVSRPLSPPTARRVAQHCMGSCTLVETLDRRRCRRCTRAASSVPRWTRDVHDRDHASLPRPLSSPRSVLSELERPLRASRQ